MVKNAVNQNVAVGNLEANGLSFDLKVAKGMDASLVAVAYLTGELLKDEVSWSSRVGGPVAKR